MQLLNLALKFYGIVKSLEMIMENIEEKNKDESLGETFKTVIYAIVIAGLIRTFCLSRLKSRRGQCIRRWKSAIFVCFQIYLRLFAPFFSFQPPRV